MTIMKWFKYACWIAGGLAMVASPAQAGSVEASDGGKAWTSWDVKTVRAAKKPDAVNRFGGSAKHKVAEPGFFRVIEKNKKWWIVDPDGHLFYKVGMNSVEADRVGRYDAKEWAGDTYEQLKGAGFNTLGRWSQPDAFKNADKPMPWCGTLSFMKDYAKQRPASNGEGRFPNETLPVFDKEWPAFCETYAKENVAGFEDDPWLFGWFSDNEIPFRPDALRKYYELPSSDPGHQAAVAWMKENKVRERDLGKDKYEAAFLEVVARKYFDTVAAALKKADPNHLYIGSRLHGRCINPPVMRGSAACDIISINYYHRWLPEEERAKDWAKWSGRPFFVSEFYAMKVESEQTKADGAGFRVLEHEDAVEFYHTYCASLIKDVPSCVGWHWFKYADDTPKWRKGIVGPEGEPHTELLEGMKVLNEQVYSLRGLR